MLHVSLLGERTIVDDVTGEVRSRSSRTVALVALLAVHAGAPQPRGRIAATFWPSSPEQQALTNLRRELHQLRRTLDDDASLVVTSTDLTWRDEETCRVDLRVFERARVRALEAPPGDAEAVLEHGTAALAAYRGELLPGLYDDWTLAQRDRLTAECVELGALVVDAGRRTGRWAEALQAARRRVELDPLDEVGYRDLIRVHAEMGDRAGAVSTYHHCASVLHEELGIEPDPATRKLLADLVDRPAAQRPDTRTVVASVDFVGRRDELGRLSSTMTEAFAGSLRATLVVGEPGVGKSRLVAEAARMARHRDAVVALAHCYGTPGRLALAPVAEWLGHPTLAAAVDTLAPLWRAEVERLVPMSDQAPRPDGPRGVVDASQRHRFFQGLARALRATSRPLLLVLENVQWCDEETLDFLSFLVGTESQASLMIALTGRTSELSDVHGHGDWVRRMRAAGVLDEIVLAPFGSEETAELVRLLAGADVPDDVVQLLGSATGGFPLFVVEAARHGGGQTPADAPTDLEDVLRARFDQLGATARQVAGLAAASGRDFDLELLCEAADLPQDTVVRAVDELWRLRILRELRHGYDFSHDLLRATAYHLVSPPGRWLLHRRLAQSLEIIYAGRTDEVAAQLADQYARAGNAARAIEHYHQAAEVAARLFAHAEAIRLHRAAREQLAGLPPGADRDRLEVRTLTSMAASLNALRGYSDAELESTLERTVALAERLSQRATLGDALVALWASRFVQGDISGAHRLALRGIGLVDTAPGGADEALIGQVHFAVAGSSLSLGMPATAVRHFETTIAHATDEQSLSIGSHPAIHARAFSAHGYWLLGETATAEANAAEAIDRARAVEHPYSLAIALAYASVTWQLLGKWESLERCTDELEELSTRLGFAYYPEWGWVLGGWVRDDAAGTSRMAQGRGPERARAILDSAVVSARARDDRWWLPEVLRQRAGLSTGQAAADALREALALAEEQGSVPLAERCRLDLATLRTPAERPPS